MSPKDVVVVYYGLGLHRILKKSLPNVDVRNAIIEDCDSLKPAAIRMSRKVIEDELSIMKEADILVTNSMILSQILYDLPPKLKWIQLSNAGVDPVTKAVQVDKPIPSFTICRNIGKGIGDVMAEYVVGQMICHERSWYLSRQNQMQKNYEREDKFSQYRSLSQVHAGMLGLGPLALQVANSLKQFGCGVSGYSRTVKREADKSPNIDTYWHSGQLSSFLSECDYLVCILPSTPETRGMLGNDVLKGAKKSPVLMNMGRGDLISEIDLIRALDAGWISAAILDVFEKEPLPQESALWNHPKVVMTPHVSAFGNADVRGKAVVECFQENYQCYLNGLPLRGTVDWKSGY